LMAMSCGPAARPPPGLELNVAATRERGGRATANQDTACKRNHTHRRRGLRKRALTNMRIEMDMLRQKCADAVRMASAGDGTKHAKDAQLKPALASDDWQAEVTPDSYTSSPAVAITSTHEKNMPTDMPSPNTLPTDSYRSYEPCATPHLKHMHVKAPRLLRPEPGCWIRVFPNGGEHQCCASRTFQNM